MGERIEQIAEEAGGKKALSRKTDIHETQLYRWISEEGLPSASGLVTLSRECGVNLEWLACGDGPKWRDGRDRAHSPADEGPAPLGRIGLYEIVDQEILAGVIEGLEEIEEERRTKIHSDLRAELIVVLYDYFHEQEHPEITIDETSKVISIFNHLKRKRGDDETEEGTDEGRDQGIG